MRLEAGRVVGREEGSTEAEGEEEAGGAEVEEDEQKRGGSVLRSLSAKLLGEEKRVRMKSGGFHIPSSIDIRPMVEQVTNAYAPMGSSRSHNYKNQKQHSAKRGEKPYHTHCSIINHLRNQGIMPYFKKKPPLLPPPLKTLT